jgi:hypothetical protein
MFFASSQIYSRVFLTPITNTGKNKPAHAPLGFARQAPVAKAAMHGPVPEYDPLALPGLALMGATGMLMRRCIAALQGQRDFRFQ